MTMPSASPSASVPASSGTSPVSGVTFPVFYGRAGNVPFPLPKRRPIHTVIGTPIRVDPLPVELVPRIGEKEEEEADNNKNSKNKIAIPKEMKAV